MSNSAIANTLTCEPFRAWNRLEQRPRTREFDRVLRAEVHDPLWFLTRQWQFGEFKGEDTGSAIFAKIKMETTRLARFQNHNNPAVAYNEEIPLEARVERMPVQYDLRFRARAGQYWSKMVRAAGKAYNVSNGYASGAPDYFDHVVAKQLFVSLYPFVLPEIDRQADSTEEQIAKSRLLADQKVHQSLTLLSGRETDGVAWAQALLASGNPPTSLPATLTGNPAFNPAHTAFVLNAAQTFFAWFRDSHTQPDQTSDQSWQPSHLEYRFACSLPNTGTQSNTVLEAEEYYQGRLDWYAFNHALNDDGSGLLAQNSSEAASKTKTEFITMLPSEAGFSGMPKSRWWEFEDGYVDLGNISADTTDVAKILLTEFALMYSNDWFLVPFPTEAGTLSEVKGIVVTDTFGEKTLISAAPQADSIEWNGWTMFNLTRNNASHGINGKVDPRVFIPPAISKIQEGKPVESVLMLRDEMANMVWAVENTVPDLHGGGQDGNTAAVALDNYWKKLDRDQTPVASPVPPEVRLQYSMANSVPENWIPFLPTHLPGQNRAIQLQRASLPRWFNGDYSPIRPRTDILREGMAQTPGTAQGPFVNPSDELQTSPYYVFEEEVPRAGVRIESSWQRARWYGGKTVCWYGRRKQTGKGEGSSGLAFDLVTQLQEDEL
jgi:hypothetical protein